MLGWRVAHQEFHDGKQNQRYFVSENPGAP